jgi:acyl-CoA reductase-like NAD-dependent aldehyde dehydrogenase
VVLNPTVAVTVLNPATEEPIAELAEAGIEETDAAVARARAEVYNFYAGAVDKHYGETIPVGAPPPT